MDLHVWVSSKETDVASMTGPQGVKTRASHEEAAATHAAVRCAASSTHPQLTRRRSRPPYVCQASAAAPPSELVSAWVE